MEFITKKRSDKEKKKKDMRLRINVGGVIFDTWASTLERITGTRLALLAHMQDGDESWDSEKQEFFFDRHPGAFMCILHYYRTEELHVDQNLCGNIIEKELEFWGLTELDIEPCCWGHYSKFKDHRETLAALDDNFTQQFELEAWGDKPTNLQKFKRRMWQFLEEPSTGRGAKVYAVVSMFFVILSIGIFCLETYKWFRVPIPGAKPLNTSSAYDAYKAGTGDYCFRQKNNGDEYAFSDMEPHPAMMYLDYICAAYFTIEFVFRFFFSPSKLLFMKGALNVIDLLCLIPHLIAIIMVTVDPYGSRETSNLFKSMLALRTVRILRIFKLMKHYSAFKILVYTIKVSTKELLLMVVFLFTGVLIFASIIFYTENETFDSIPVGFWWALVTMTTVGYGDKVPRSELGYIIGCVCVLCGVLTVAFTVPIVVNNFALYYSHAQSRIKLPVHKRKELKRKLFLKNQKSLEFLEKLKWRRDKHKKEFTELDAIKSPRAPPCGKEADKEASSPPNKTNSPTFFTNQVNTAYIDTDENDAKETVANIRRSVTPDRVNTVSETLPDFVLPNTPSDIVLGDDQHNYETRQLLNELADADNKMKEERKRQLDIINQKREQKRQQLADQGKTPRTPRQTPRQTPAPAAAARHTLRKVREAEMEV